VSAIDNRRIAKIAKLAGAPDAWAAGVERHKWVGEKVEAGEPLYTIHAETPGELEYALAFAAVNDSTFTVRAS
jgi:thymidine phosphorylase